MCVAGLTICHANRFLKTSNILETVMIHLHCPYMAKAVIRLGIGLLLSWFGFNAFWDSISVYIKQYSSHNKERDITGVRKNILTPTWNYCPCRSLLFSHPGALLAQWVKRWPTDIVVPGSSPAQGEIFSTVNGVPLHQPFIVFSPSSWYDRNTVEKDVNLQVITISS